MSVDGVLYLPNPDFERELVRSTFVALILHELAEHGETLYREGVPVAEGDLRDSIFSSVELTADGYRGRVGATDWKAALVEFGTSLRAPDGSLRRAIEATGLTIEGDHETG